MYTRMIIVEAINAECAKHYVNEVQLTRYSPNTDHELLVEEGGFMVVWCITFNTLADAVAMSKAREYRQFVTSTQHLLVGEPVHKLFKREI